MVSVGDTNALIQYVDGRAPQFGIDPAAALAIASQEGWNGMIGDNGLAYGPWQDHVTEFAGRPWFGSGTNNQQVQTWAWSNQGIDYALQQMASTGKAQGLSGLSAIEAIAINYERPAAQNLANEIKNAWNRYTGFNSGTDTGTAGSVSTVDPALAAGAQLVSAQSQSAGTSEAPSLFGNTQLGKIVARLASPGFWWSVGFFVLAAVLILVGLFIVFRQQIQQTVTNAGKAAGVAA